MPKSKYKTYVPAKKATSLRDYVFGAMLLIVVGIMPLIVRHTQVMAAPELTALIRWEFRNDFFAHYKGWFLGVPATVMAFYAIADWLGEGFTKSKLVELIKSPPIAVACLFLFMALISTIFTSYRHTSWHGTVERGEGMLILIAYFIVFFSAMHFARTDKHAKILMYGLAFSSIIMGLIGFSQFIGRDFFVTGIGARLVMGNWDHVPDQEFTIAYGTLYNPNTFGIFSAMTAPILLACALAYDGRKWMRTVFLAGGILMLIGIMGSGNLGGFIGISAAVAVTVFTLLCRFFYQMRRSKKEHYNEETGRRNTLTWLISGTVLVALLVGLFFVPVVNQRFHSMLGRLGHAARREALPTYNYIVDGDRLTVLWQDDEKFTLVLLEEEYGPDRVLWHIYDAGGQPIPLVSREIPPAVPGQPREPWPVTFSYNIPGRRNLIIHREEGFVIAHNLVMLLHEGRIHAFAPNFTDIIDLTVPIPAIGFYGNETWASNRGHIWSRTFPLMPARAIIGSGPDTYALVFPQHDVIGKMRFHGHPYRPIGMAHNVYLQTWVTTGRVSALALMFLFGYYLFTSYVSIVRSRMKEGPFMFGLRFGMLAGISAFCISALATDSTIGTSGVFYLLLGLGYGVNYLVGRVYREAEEVAVA